MGESTDEIVLDGNLTIWIDTQPPTGDGHLYPDSDTGPWSETLYRSDRLTADRTPSFYGTAEANSIVTVSIDGVPAGTTVASPLGGNSAFQPGNATYQNVEGNWQIDSTMSLSDGPHTATFTFEDVAGNRYTPSQPLTFTVDTQGPRVTDVRIGSAPNYDLFDLKPSDGPTPLVNSLVFTITDGPLYTTATYNKANYQVVGDSNGIIPIKSVVSAVAIPSGTTFVTISFYEPLPDDRFTLTIADNLIDIAGNALDGESNAIQPTGAPVFPSGDGEPGGDFVARFTVDSRAEVGVWSAGSAYLDTNGNFQFDAQSADFVNPDLVHTIGFSSDVVLAGNFVQDRGGTANGFDKLAAYGRANGSYRWLVDFNGDGMAEGVFTEPAGFNNTGIPVAGNFDGNAANGDEVGVFTGSAWRFDTDHDFSLADEKALASNMTGFPVVGDFDGDGRDDLGTWNVSANRFSLSLTRHGGGPGRPVVTDSFRFGTTYGFIGVRERPVAADMDGDGIDDLGLWVADRAGMTPGGQAEWYFMVSDGDSILARLEPDPLSAGSWTAPFWPFPFGYDLFAQYGNQFGVPVVGNFDPPVAPRRTHRVAVTREETASAGTQQLVAVEPQQTVIPESQQPVAEEPEPAVVVESQQQTTVEPEQPATVEPKEPVIVAPPQPTTVEVEQSVIVEPEQPTSVEPAQPVIVEPAQPATVETQEPAVVGPQAPANVEAQQPVATVATDATEEAGTLEVAQAEEEPAPDVVQLVGTPANDTVLIIIGPRVAEINGVWQEIEGDKAAIVFDGLGGEDSVMVMGSSANETAVLWPDHSVFTGPSLSVAMANVETTTLIGGGGNDTATLYDSPGDDQFTATPGAASLQGLGFSLQALGFSTATAQAVMGGTDVASLHGNSLASRFGLVEAEVDQVGHSARVSNTMLGYAVWALDFEVANATTSPDETSDVAAAIDYLFAHGYW